MTRWTVPPGVAVAGAAIAGSFAGAHAQAFDLTRAALNDSTVFAPFVVSTTVPLRDALADGAVDRETRIVVFEQGGAPLALVTAQLAYHHLAQGEMAGEPWMVSF